MRSVKSAISITAGDICRERPNCEIAPLIPPHSAFRISSLPFTSVHTAGRRRFVNHDLAQAGAFGRKLLPKPGCH